MKIKWEEKIRAAMLEKGISVDDISDLINGVIDDAVEDEKDDARQNGWVDGQLSERENQFYS